MIISCRNVGKRYATQAGEVIAVDNVSVDFAAGEFIVLFGKSGSGKTTLLSMISGLFLPSSGTISAAGYPMHELDFDQRATVRRQAIGVVFQDHNLIEELTVIENVMLPALASHTDPDKAHADGLKALGQLGIADLAQRLPAEISGGQRQRTGIARALAGDKKILLTDEPTGSLDVDNSRLIFDTLRLLSRSGVCIVCATHDPLGAEYADRTLLMSDGKLTETTLTTSH